MLVLAAAALFSTGGAAIKATSLTGWQVASFRSAVAAISIALMLPGARRRPSLAMVAVAVADLRAPRLAIPAAGADPPR